MPPATPSPPDPGSTDPGTTDPVGYFADLADDSLSEAAIASVKGAFAEAVAAAPPERLRDGTLRGASARRRPDARPGADDHHGNPVLSYRRGVDSLRTVIESLTDWSAPAVNGFDAHGLVCHLAAVETWFASTLGACSFDVPGGLGPNDHLGISGPLALTLRGRPPAAAVTAWTTAAEAVLAALATADLSATASFYEISGPLAAVLVARLFELWTHEEDLRRATLMPLSAPGAASLAMMTDLGVTALPKALHGAGLADSRTIEITLTGAGAGHWLRALDGGDPSEPSAHLVCDAVAMCRVIANRYAPSELLARPTTVVEGDRDLVERVLLGATHLASD